MAINTISNSNSLDQTSASGQTKATSGTEALDRQDFMKLLIAQLRNQDPNNPVDAKELVTQLSQLTSVEQLVTIGERIQGLEATAKGMAANQSSSLIGKSVEARNDSVQLTATGSASSSVKLGQGADQVTVKVVNEAGRVVRSFELTDKSEGLQPISWDGYEDNQARAANGSYRFEVSAKNKAGNPVTADMKVSGVVSGVSYENGAPELVLGTTRVPLSNVTSISQ